jgi:hypothetical protein
MEQQQLGLEGWGGGRKEAVICSPQTPGYAVITVNALELIANHAVDD